MSELIAEARVLVRPDTTGFRSLLITEVTAAAAGVTVPVQVTPVLAGGAGVASARELAGAQAAVASSSRQVTDEIKGADAARKAAAAGELAQARRLQGISSGAASAGLSLVGLRGATLAASGPFLAGAAGAIALGKALGIATSFNSEIAVLGATTEATGEQLAVASEAARQFGRDITLPGVTAGEAAQTITEFAKAGLSLNDSIAATRGGLQLAQAAQLSYADAVTLTANALNAFGLSGNQAVRVADTLANAANLAQGGITDTALALRQAAGAAAVVGVSFEDTAALLTLLARNGLTGSDAGTALRTAFLRLVNPSKEAQKILKDLNVQLRDVNGNVRPEVFADFAAAQRDLTQAQQQANAAIVFGQDAFRAFGFLGREGRQGLDEVTAGLQKTGTAARIAQARMVGLRGAQENLSNQLNDLGLTVGQLASGPLTVMVGLLGEYVGVVNAAAQGTLNFAQSLNNLGPGPSTTDILGRVDFTKGLESLAGSINPALGELVRFRDLFGSETEETAETIKNGGVELRSAIEDSGREAARGAVSFQDQIIGSISTAFSAIRTAIQQRQTEIRGDQLRAARQGANQAAGLEEVFNQVVAQGGSQQQQLAVLKRQAEVQAKIIREAGPEAAGVLLQARREAQARLASINSQRQAIEEQIASDARAASEERLRTQQQAASLADQSLLNRQDLARQRQQNRITQAEDTPNLRDDIQRTQELRNLIKAQIQQVRERIGDEKTKQAALASLRQAVFTTTQEIRGLIAAQREQREANRQAIFDRREENADLRLQIAEARGNEDAVLKLLDARIKIAQQAVARAKKAKEGILKAILELEELKKKRRELLKEASEDEQGGTTAFQLLTDAAQRFGVAGNLIGANQPFAGPTEFTADLSQFLRRNNTTTTTTSTGTGVIERNDNRFLTGVDRIVDALNRNTDALNGGEGGPTVRKGRRPPVSGAIERNDRRWLDSKQARDTIEGAGG